MANPQLMSNLVSYPSSFGQLDPRIKRIKVTKEQFDERRMHIIKFSTRLLKANEGLGLVITRPVVEFFWGLAVWGVYPTENHEKSRLMGQANSPIFEIFWQKRNDFEGFKAKMARQRESSTGFWPFPRYLSAEEVKNDRGMLIMGNLDWEYIIPEIALSPLYVVHFSALGKKIMVANPERPLNIGIMRRLWRMLMKEVYDFVPESERTAKLLEADAVTDHAFKAMTGSIPTALSKKRETEPESRSDDERTKRRGHRSKRKKTVTFAEPKATDMQSSNERNVELAVRGEHSTETDGQQPTLDFAPSVPNQALLDKTRRITVLETKLKDASRELAEANAQATTAKLQAADFKRERGSLDQKLKSQTGQLKAAERHVRQLINANRHAREDMEARSALEHQLKSLDGQLRRSAQSERDLRAEKGRLEALLMEARVDTRDKK